MAQTLVCDCVDACNEVSTTCVSRWDPVAIYVLRGVECLAHPLTRVVLTSCSRGRESGQTLRFSIGLQSTDCGDQ
jgi:hypothetical protein